jgi:hypothetical protein
MADRYPLADVPAEIAAWVQSLGGRPLNLYRVLANAPAMLTAWVDFVYAIRRPLQDAAAVARAHDPAHGRADESAADKVCH